MDGQPVKIYQCYNEKHAKYIEVISNHFPGWLPDCLLRIEDYIVAEWVEGKQLTIDDMLQNETILFRIAELQAELHNSMPPFTFDNDRFDYLKDYLKVRLCKYKAILPIHNTICRLFEVIDHNIGFLPNFNVITHPDMSFRNLILTNTNDLIIVDNELLTYSNYYSIDLFNTCKSLESKGEALLYSYLKHYVKSGGTLDLLLEYKDLFFAIWSIRLIGSMLQSGKYGKVLQFTRELDSNIIKPESYAVIKLAKKV